MLCPSADPDRTPAAWRSDFCRESQGWVGKSRSRLGPKWPRSMHVSAPHALCDVRHTVRARARALLRYTRKLCELPTMRSCTRAHPPTVPNRGHSLFFFCGEARLRPMSSVVLHPRDYRGPGSSSRPRDPPPASADPDRTHFTTLTIRDDESPSADDPGSSEDDLRAIRRRPPGHLQTTSGPSACRRPPGHPHADDLRAIRMQTTLSKETPLSWKTVGAAVIVITGRTRQREHQMRT